MKYPSLSRAEALIRKVVEEPFAWLAGGTLEPFQLAKHLTKEFIEPATSSHACPNHFIIYVNPEDYSGLGADIHTLETQVADYVTILSGRLEVTPVESISVSIQIDNALDKQKARVEASQSSVELMDKTGILTDVVGDSSLETLRTIDAFLIIQGRRHVPLDQPIIRIGRRIDNDIVLDTPSVSREHAQIRWRQRYFVLYDISSHGRTLVNGDAIQEHILRPGDVISLSDVLLVYGEGLDDRAAIELWPENDEMASTMLRPKNE